MEEKNCQFVQCDTNRDAINRHRAAANDSELKNWQRKHHAFGESSVVVKGKIIATKYNVRIDILPNIGHLDSYLISLKNVFIRCGSIYNSETTSEDLTGLVVCPG